MNTRSMALAAHIYHDCTHFGWDRTAAQVAADMIDRYPAAKRWQPSAKQVARILRARGWTGYLRRAGTAPNVSVPVPVRMDAELAVLAGDRDFDDLDISHEAA